jgi:hypothetical protein
MLMLWNNLTMFFVGDNGVNTVFCDKKQCISQARTPRMQRGGSGLDGLSPKSLFALSKTFFDKSKALSRRFENSPSGLRQFKSLIFCFAKIY